MDAAPSLLWFLLVLGLGLIAYGPSFHAEFQFDDHSQILDNPAIHDPTWSLIIWWGRTRLLPFATFALNYQLGGKDPFGYHVISVLMHLLSAFVVYLLAWELCRTPRLRGTRIAERPLLVALPAALMFTLHPIQVQAVTYIVQRASVMATLFYTASVLCYVRAHTAQTAGEVKKRSQRQFFFAVLFALAAAFSKENAASLPLAILLTEWVFFRAHGGIGRAVLRCVPFVAIAIAMPIAFKVLDRRAPPPKLTPQMEQIFRVVGPPQTPSPRPTPAPPRAATAPGVAPSAAGVSSDTSGPLGWVLQQVSELVAALVRAAAPAEAISPANYFFTQCRVIPRYVRLVLIPTGFNVDHDVPIEPQFSPPVAAGLALLLALMGFGFYAVRRWPLVGYGVLWLFVALSVESSILPIRDVMNEHRMYLAMPGIALALAVPWAAALRTYPLGGRLGSAAVVAGLAVLSFARNEVWRTQLSLWQDALQKSPGKARVQVNVGTALHLQGDLHAAVEHYCEAMRLEPANRRAESNLNIALDALMEAGDVEMEIVSTGPDGSMELLPKDPCKKAEDKAGDE